jgi:putative hydrolase of the HAD superfamily
LIRAVFFDATGTLIALREPVGQSYSRVARDHGVDIPARRLEDAFRRVMAQAPPMLYPHATAAQVPAHERDWWREVVRRTFLAADSARRFRNFEGCFGDLWQHFSSLEAWKQRAGASSLLRRLQQRGLLTAVVSNFDARLPALLRGLDLASHLHAIILPSQARALKPDPAIFAFALERLGVSAAEGVFVGDDLQRDIEGARTAGLRAVDVSSLATLDALDTSLAALDRDVDTPTQR